MGISNDSSLLNAGFALSRKLGVGPDFSVYTGTMKTAGVIPIAEADTEKPIVQMRGSSTVMDLQGDIMALSALQDMTHLDSEFLIFTDHSYDLDNIFGKIYSQPVIQMAGNIADLWLAVEAAIDHPPALRAYNLIVKSKLRLGCSIGCMVLDWHFLDSSDPSSPLIVDRIDPIEYSVVSLPANQRCWVENAIKGRFARALVEGQGDMALELAPAVKGLFGRDYSSIVENITSVALRKDLGRVPARSEHPQRIMYSFEESREGFMLDTGRSGLKKSITREEAAVLLASGAPLHKQPDLTKTATGKTSFPLTGIDTEWTGSKAESQIFAWAKDDDGTIQASKAKQCFLWSDPEKSDVQAGYKMPFCYIDDSPKIVPLGVRAAAGVLHGGMGGGKFGDDESAMRSKVETLYGRINSEFNPDPKWVVPWKQDKSLLDSSSGSALNRQDLGEVEEVDKGAEKKNTAAMPDAKDVEVASDGTHVACKGTHTHAHSSFGSQGDDDSHSHAHSHDGDASHDHEHEDAQKSAEPDTTTKAEAPVSENSSVESETAPEQKSVELDTLTLARLSLYNDLGKLLSLPELSVEQYKVKCNLVSSDSDAQSVISTLSMLDACSDGLTSQVAQVESLVNSLMILLRVPDVDGGYGYANTYNANTQGIVTKEGRALNADNRALVKTIHDAAASMHPDVCNGVTGDGTAHQPTGTTLEDAQRQAAAMGQGSNYETNSFAHAMETALTKAFDGLSVKSLVEARVKEAVSGALAKHRAELDEAQRQIATLKDMPLGRPTTLNRSIQQDPRAASYEEMLTAGGNQTLPETLAELESLTRVVSKTLYDASGKPHQAKYRAWPEGVGGAVNKGLRPALTPAQKGGMLAEEWAMYNIGGSVEVPMIDDPFEKAF